MWPFLLVPAALLAIFAFRRSKAGRERERRRGLNVVTAIAVVVATAGVLPFMGIPGAIVHETAAPMVHALTGKVTTDLGDGAWPAAIITTMTWPWSLVLAYTLAYGPLRHRGRAVRWLVMALVPYAAAVLLALWAHGSAGI
jgi:hypothetical protein